MPGLQNMKTRNDTTECVENQCAHSNPPTHHTDLLAHRQSEYPVAQTVDSPPPQTSHVESEQTTSERLRKRPNAAEHTKHICSRPRPSLSKCFKSPTVGPVCSCLRTSLALHKDWRKARLCPEFKVCPPTKPQSSLRNLFVKSLHELDCKNVNMFKRNLTHLVHDACGHR